MSPVTVAILALLQAFPAGCPGFVSRVALFAPSDIAY